MRPASPALIARLGSDTTSTAWLLKITRTDGTVLAFTSHDQSLTVSGVRYLASNAFLPSGLDSKSDLSVSNMQLNGVLGTIASDSLTEDDIAAGYYDQARIGMGVCDWQAPQLGSMPILRGFLGDATMRGDQYQIDVRSLSETLQKSRGRIISPQCDAVLGDARCGVNIAAFEVAAQVASTDGGQTLSAEAIGGRPDGCWRDGLLRWTSGANAGSSIEVRSSAGTGLTLWLPAPRPIAAGDAFTVRPGCSHDMTETGCKKFGPGYNLRFRGFADVPGLDAVLAYPDATV